MEETNIAIPIKSKNQQVVHLNISIKKNIKTLLEQLFSVSRAPKNRMRPFQGFPSKRVTYSPSNLVESIEVMDTLLVGLDSSVTCGKAQSTSNSTLEVSSSLSNITDYNTAALIGGVEGIVVRKTVPPDNSCLFTSIAFALSKELKASLQSKEFLRRLVSITIASDTTKFNAAFLGRTNADYVKWILKSESWGGGIELSILAEHYEIEIDVVDIKSLSIFRFEEDKNYPHRIYLIYDGFHYDPLYFQPLNGLNYQTVFSTADETAQMKVLELAREAKSAQLYMNRNNFKFKCRSVINFFVVKMNLMLHARK